MLSQGRLGSVSTEALRWIQKKHILQKEKAEAELQLLGAGWRLVLSQIGTGTRSEMYSHANKHQANKVGEMP